MHAGRKHLAGTAFSPVPQEGARITAAACDRRIPYEEGLGDVYTLIGGSSWGMVLLALVLAVLWVLLQTLRLRWAEAEDQTRASSSPGSKPA